MDSKLTLRKLQFIICAFLIVPMVIFTSCSSSDEDSIVPNGAQIRFGTGVDLLKATSIGKQLPKGQQVGIFISEDAASPTVTYDQNLAYIADGEGGLSGVTQYYPISNGVKISAYHPYSSQENDQYVFSVSTDQSTDAGVYASDLLYCGEFSQARTDGVIKILLSHKLSQITYELNAGQGSPELEGAQVTVMNVNTAVEFNRKTGALGTTSAKGEIKLNTGGGIIIPQTIPAGTKLLKITLKDGREMFYTTETETTLGSNQNHKFKLKINQNNAIGGETEVGDWDESGVTPGDANEEASDKLLPLSIEDNGASWFFMSHRKNVVYLTYDSQNRVSVLEMYDYGRNVPPARIESDYVKVEYKYDGNETKPTGFIERYETLYKQEYPPEEKDRVSYGDYMIDYSDPEKVILRGDEYVGIDPPLVYEEHNQFTLPIDLDEMDGLETRKDEEGNDMYSNYDENRNFIKKDYFKYDDKLNPFYYVNLPKWLIEYHTWILFLGKNNPIEIHGKKYEATYNTSGFPTRFIRTDNPENRNITITYKNWE